MTQITASAGKALLRDNDDEVEALRAQVASLSAQLQQARSSQQQQPQPSSAASSKTNNNKRRYHPLSPHSFNVREVRTSTNKSTITAQREKLGRTASISTRQVLDNLEAAAGGPDSAANPPYVQRILDMFARPSHHMEYLNSEVFFKDLLKLAQKAKGLFEREPRVVFLQSPSYVFGDIHGNLEDLHFFSDNIWRLGMSLTAGSFLFLGDYVDRGLHCLECVAYLFAMKLQLPNKVFLLRGNHETRDINGWEEHYGERSFIYQCRSRFGDDAGYRIWEACNQAFDRMPLSAVIDQDIFCVHGGIPRPVSSSPGATRIQDILAVPKVAGINPPYEHEDERYQRVASDCVWSDPATEEQEMVSVDPDTGFGESRRGGGAICFGNKAVTNFLEQHDFSYIMRAHEAHAEGVAVSKEARVFTVFSTSQDHNQGSQAMAGCILVDNERLQVINRSPAYKNQYVHRRDSISLAQMPESEIAQRMKLGLVTSSSEDAGDGGGQEDDEDLDDWQDLEDDKSDDKDEEEDYALDSNRRSSIDLSSISNTHDDTGWASDASTSSFASFTESEQPNKRHRSKRPGFASISEETAEEDVDTVDGEDDTMELRDEDQA